MKTRINNLLYWPLWFTGGAFSLFLTLYGCFAWMMLDYRNLEELCLGLCLILPLPSFLIGLSSKEWSAALLWFTFVALWVVRAQIHPNPALNPVDSLGVLYLCPATAVQQAIFFAPKKETSVAPE